MWRLQYRNFGSHEALVGNFVTDVDGTDHGGIRWFELRKTAAAPWALFQEGTQAPDQANRWMGSIAMDKDGNMALGYSVSEGEPLPPDPNEPNNTLAEATPIPCPFTSVDTSIDPLGDVDFYAFEAMAGDRVTIDIDANQLGSPLDSVLGLFDSTGTLLALSDDNPAPGEPFTTDSFLQFIMPSTGTFFIAVSSFADFDFNGGEDAFFTGPYTLSVACTPSPPPSGLSIFAVNPIDSTIVELDTGSGAVLNSFPTPEPVSGQGAEGLAHSGSSLFFVDGLGTNTIFELDPETGDILQSFPAPVAVNGTDSLAFAGGALFSLDFDANTIFKLDPTSGDVISSCETEFDAVGGLAGGEGRLFVTEAFTSIAEVNPDTCEVIGGPFPSPNNEAIFGLAFDGNSLFAGSVDTNTIFELDPATGAVLSSFPTAFPPSALASAEGERCTLTLAASFADGLLSLDFNLGTLEPMTWNVWLTSQSETINLVLASLPVIDPPIPFDLTLPFFPSVGTIGILTTLTTPEGGIICSEFVLVDTGPRVATLAVAVQGLQEPVRQLTEKLGQRLQLRNVE